MANLEQGGVGTRAVQHRWNHVLIGLGGLAQRLEPALDQGIVPLRTHLRNTTALLLFGIIGNLQDLDRMVVVG